MALFDKLFAKSESNITLQKADDMFKKFIDYQIEEDAEKEGYVDECEIESRKRKRSNTYITFKQSCDYKDGKLYLVQLSKVLGDDKIPYNYYLIMKGIRCYLTIMNVIGGKPEITLPSEFEYEEKSINLYNFGNYDMTMSAGFMQYKGYVS